MSTINLLPEDYILRRSQHHANILCMTLLFIVLGAVGAAAIMSECSMRHTLHVRDRVNKSYDEAAKLIRQMQELEVSRGEMLKKAQLTAALLEKTPRSYLLAITTNALPERACLTKFQLDTERIVSKDVSSQNARFAAAAKKNENVSVTNVTARITGLAATDVEVARLITNLARNPLTESVDLVYSQEKQVGKIPVREFQIKLVIRPDADAMEAQRQMGNKQATGKRQIPGAIGS